MEPIREPTPSVSLSRISSTNRSKSKSKRETSEHSKSEGSVRDIAQSKELSQQHISTSPQLNIPPLIVQQSSVRTELDKDWETFNDLINIEAQNTQTPVRNVQTTINIVTGVTTNVSKKEHIPITPSSELMLKIEEIPPLDVFYSPQHKAVVRRQEEKEIRKCAFS